MNYSGAMEFIKSVDSLLLSTHMNADGDGIGSLLALSDMLKQMGRQHRIVVNDDRPDPKFAFLSGFDRIESYKSLEAWSPISGAVFLDTPTITSRRVGNVAHLLSQSTRTLIVDHHADDTDDGSVVLIDPNASATSEIVFGLIKKSGVSINPDIATHLYTGIAFDTKLFKFSHPERALKVCAELVDFGAGPQAIAESLFSHQSLETVKTLGVALSNLSLHFDGQVSTLFIDDATFSLGGDLDTVIDHAMSIQGVKAALFFKEEKPGWHRISLRSRGEVNVNQIARKFGGGGHKRASGCMIEASLEVAQKRLLKEMKQHILDFKRLG